MDVTRSARLRDPGLALFLCMALLGSAPSMAAAQPAPRVPRVGMLMPGAPDERATLSVAIVSAFREGLRELGHVEGQTVTLEFRFASGNPERYPDLVAELLRLPVDVFLALSVSAVPAVRKATTTVPVVAATLGDPVAAGWAQSFARPGGNVTGLTHVNADLLGKRVQLLKEAVPGVRRMALLWNPRPASSGPRPYEAAAAALGVRLHVLQVRSPTDLDSAFQAVTRDGAKAVVLAQDPLFGANRERLAALA